MEGIVADARAEVVINTASMTDVDRCQRNPQLAYASNVESTVHLCRAAGATGAHLIHVSTDYVFDGESGPYGEEDVPNPRGTYATTKHIAEQAVRVLAPSWTIARTAVVSTLRKGESVRLFEDQFVSPTLALNVAAMLAEIAERKLGGTWNACGASVVDRLTFGRALCGVFGFNSALCIGSKVDDAKLDSPRPRRCGLRSEKAAAQLQAKPLPLAEALAAFHAEYLRHQG